jgi:very-short-patch-repair endonuclease
MNRVALPLWRAKEATFMARSKQHQQLITQLRLTERASAMRANPTTSEAALWSKLQANQLGVAFRRQVPLGGRFIADFLAPAVRVIVEVDGGYHGHRTVADARRDRDLIRLGYTVLHLEAELVLSALPEAVERVRSAVVNVCSVSRLRR